MIHNSCTLLIDFFIAKFMSEAFLNFPSASVRASVGVVYDSLKSPPAACNPIIPVFVLSMLYVRVCLLTARLAKLL